jgi:Icc-related predicted phosphoesterase
LGRIKLTPKSTVLWSTEKAPKQRGMSSRLVFGVLADTKEALPETLKHLDWFIAQFKRHRVMALILLGGIDPTFEGIRAVLHKLQLVAPVLALPGDRESQSGFQAAAEAFTAKVIDLVQLRGVVLPGLSILAVPGYYLPHHLMAAEQGCSYTAKDMEQLVTLAQTLPPPRLLLAHGPPRQSGSFALDWAFGQVNIGDPLLAKLLVQADIHFGLFGHVHESAGRATTREGQAVEPMSWSKSLLLNVGAVDAVPHENLAGQWSYGTAAIVEIAQGQARYQMLSAPPPPAP